MTVSLRSRDYDVTVKLPFTGLAGGGQYSIMHGKLRQGKLRFDCVLFSGIVHAMSCFVPRSRDLHGDHVICGYHVMCEPPP